MQAEEPSLPCNAIERGVPPHGLARAGDGLHSDRVELMTNVAFPTWHRGDVGLHWRIAISLGDLWIAAGEELGLGLGL